MITVPLLLLPGTLCDASLWSHQLTHLVEVGPVGVADVTREATLSGLARRILETAPARFALVGLSLGGVIAFKLLRQAPERVAKLALLSTNARAFTPEQRTQWRALAEATRRGQFDELVAHWLELVSAGRTLPAALRDGIQRMAHAISAEAFGRQIQVKLERPDSRPTLAQITCPTLVLAGREDPLCPVAMHAEIAAGIPDAQLVVVEQCGH